MDIPQSQIAAEIRDLKLRMFDRGKILTPQRLAWKNSNKLSKVLKLPIIDIVFTAIDFYNLVQDIKNWDKKHDGEKVVAVLGMINAVIGVATTIAGVLAVFSVAAGAAAVTVISVLGPVGLVIGFVIFLVSIFWKPRPPPPPPVVTTCIYIDGVVKEYCDMCSLCSISYIDGDEKHIIKLDENSNLCKDLSLNGENKQYMSKRFKNVYNSITITSWETSWADRPDGYGMDDINPSRDIDTCTDKFVANYCPLLALDGEALCICQKYYCDYKNTEKTQWEIKRSSNIGYGCGKMYGY